MLKKKLFCFDKKKPVFVIKFGSQIKFCAMVPGAMAPGAMDGPGGNGWPRGQWMAPGAMDGPGGNGWLRLQWMAPGAMDGPGGNGPAF
jgi:hypothetical protein